MLKSTAMKKPIRILGIETSCDETAMAVLEVDAKEDMKVLSNIVSSQVKLHAKYGGVVPSLAAREHVKNIGHVFRLALKEAGINPPSAPSGGGGFEKEIDLIAVTRGPGLGPALLVGITFAKTLSWIYKKPIMGANHLEGHLYSNWLNKGFKPREIKFPILHLIVSGGHTELVLMRGHGKYKIIGETLDDAVGEAFDKVARLLNLGYPGGPIVSLRAAKLKSKNEKLKILFPRPMEKSGDFNFSYSGLKTAVLYKIKDLKNSGVKITDEVINEICYEFQQAAIDILVKKTLRAAKELGAKSVFLSGGVSANKLLREKLHATATELGLEYRQPPMEYTTDNAAMIAIAGHSAFKNSKQKTAKLWQSVKMDANLGF